MFSTYQIAVCFKFTIMQHHIVMHKTLQTLYHMILNEITSEII